MLHQTIPNFALLCFALPCCRQKQQGNLHLSALQSPAASGLFDVICIGIYINLPSPCWAYQRPLSVTRPFGQRLDDVRVPTLASLLHFLFPFPSLTSRRTFDILSSLARPPGIKFSCHLPALHTPSVVTLRQSAHRPDGLFTFSYSLATTTLHLLGYAISTLCPDAGTTRSHRRQHDPLVTKFASTQSPESSFI